MEIFNNIGFDHKPRNNKELRQILEEDFDQYRDNKGHRFWDDLGEYELIEIPYYIGFGIYFGDEERFKELVAIATEKGDEEEC